MSAKDVAEALWNPFQRYFQAEPEDDEPEVDLTECREVVEFSRSPYFEKFMGYLERGSDSSLDLKDGSSMLVSGSRVNTFKEIKAHLRRQVRDAQELIDREQHNG